MRELSGEVVAIAPIVAPIGDGPGLRPGLGSYTNLTLGATSPWAAARHHAVKAGVGRDVMTGSHCEVASEADSKDRGEDFKSRRDKALHR